MFGKNPIRPPEKHDGSRLKVVNIFPTLQGEGPFVGYPSVFVRLGGCNLACSFCDTEFEAFQDMGLEAILAEVERLAGEVPPPLGGRLGGGRNGAPTEQLMAPPRPSPYRGGRLRNLVVITGGEPLRQNIVPLCEELLARGFQVQIETNGTLWRELPEEVNIVCSPKISNGTYHPLRPDLLARVDALKFIISAENAEYREVGDVGQGAYRTPVYVQPMDEYNDEKNAANLKRAAMLAQTHGYRLSLQTHKILGIE